MTKEEIRQLLTLIVSKCDKIINNNLYSPDDFVQSNVEDIAEICNMTLDGKFGELPSLHKEKQEIELYFYCKYGGIMPLCSDCKRNPKNSPFKTKGITTWYSPSNGTKQCIDYIKNQSYTPIDVDLERDAVSFCHDKGLNTTPYIAKTIALHFYKLGQLNAKKETKK